MFDGYLIYLEGLQFITTSTDLSALDGCADDKCLLIAGGDEPVFRLGYFDEGCQPSKISGVASYRAEPGEKPNQSSVLLYDIDFIAYQDSVSCLAEQTTAEELVWSKR